jgi:hypothetical protein
MKSFGQHIVAAARCIELRGPFQFRNEASVKMFLQLRRLIVRLTLILQTPPGTDMEAGYDLSSIPRKYSLRSQAMVVLG